MWAIPEVWLVAAARSGPGGATVAYSLPYCLGVDSEATGVGRPGGRSPSVRRQGGLLHPPPGELTASAVRIQPDHPEVAEPLVRVGGRALGDRHLIGDHERT